MPLQINVIEAVWLLSCISGIAVTAYLLYDGVNEFRGYRQTPNDSIRRTARVIVLKGNVRRDGVRCLMQFLLLTAAGPSLLRAGDIPIVFNLSTYETQLQTLQTVAILNLIMVPVLMLTSSALDARDRRRLRVVSEQLAARYVVNELTTVVDQRTEDIKEAIHTEVERLKPRRGDKGETGDKGAQGEQGKQGKQGERGARGTRP